MIELCADIGHKSLNHAGEQLCGDHVDIATQEPDSQVVVLADGLGSGVKACILSTLTSRIISTMFAAGLTLEDCVSTIAQTLPVCSVRGIAYSTFSILHLLHNRKAELIQFDNPKIIMLRDGTPFDYGSRERNIDGKRILYSEIFLQEGDLFALISDGCTHAGVGTSYNFGWEWSEIASFLTSLAEEGHPPKVIASLLTEECNRLYNGAPGDDVTACVVRIRKRVPMNMMFGPPEHRDDCDRMMRLFFSKEGKRIVSGGTTASIAAKFLNEPLKVGLDFSGDPEIPPVATLKGVDLVTEGVITVNRVLRNAQDYLTDNLHYPEWSVQNDGASRMSRMLFEEATDVSFYVGKAVNPAHQNPGLPISFTIKMNLVKELSEALTQMGKRVKVSYF